MLNATSAVTLTRHALEMQTVAKIKASPKCRVHWMTKQSFYRQMQAWGYTLSEAVIALRDVEDVAWLEWNATPAATPGGKT